MDVEQCEDNHITDAVVRRFVAELRRVEQTGEVDPLATPFTDDVVLHRVDRGGVGDARAYREQYRARFGEVPTVFRNAVESTGPAGPLWSAAGPSPTAPPSTAPAPPS